MKFKTEQEFLRALYRYFGLNEALRSDQSYEAMSEQICSALNAWPAKPAECLSVRWTFADRVVACAWVEEGDRSEWYAWEIPYTMDATGAITFGTPMLVDQVQLFEPVAESQKAHPNKQRLVETSYSGLSLIGESATGHKRVKAIGISAGIVNRNRRRYSRAVLADAVQRLNSKLNESAGQGRLILTGEAEHPSDKGGRANILETVFKWDAVSLNAAGQVVLEGTIIPTSKGRDLQAIAESGVPIKLSQRGYGEMSTIKEGGQTIDDVTYLEITGYDAVAEPSDPTAGLIESQQPVQETKKTMNLEELLRLLAEKPEMKEAIMKQFGLTDSSQLAESFGLTSASDIRKAIEEGAELKRQAEEARRKVAVEEAILAACKDLPYGAMNTDFVEAVRKGTPDTPNEVKALVEAKRSEWDLLFSKTKLAGMGKADSGVKVLGPVFERETGRPEFTRPAFALNESLIKRGEGHRRDVLKGESPAEILTAALLERFDKLHQSKLIQEARSFEEAEQTSDLSLPYSVSRMIIEQAYPELVAANVFDFGVASNSPERIYFEAYSGESGASPAVTSETIVAIHNDWASIANKRLQPGTVTLTNSGASTTYTDGTDYVIDYEDGKLYVFSTGAITNSQSLRINYTYDKYRAGEMVAIQRAKNSLTYTQLDMVADRLATQISREAIVFSRSQMGYDAVTRTLGNLVRLVRRKIDKDILYKALSRSLIQASNSGGTWTAASDDPALLVKYIGVAKTKVYSRFYEPTGILMSTTNSDRLSNWDGFKMQGFANAVLTSAGFSGSVKGLPIFASPEYPDTYVQVINRELVAHRIYQPMQMFGPFPSYDSNGNLIGADQYYCEEFNGSIVPVSQKTSHVKIV